MPSYFFSLPRDTQNNICGYLSLKDQARLASTCNNHQHAILEAGDDYVVTREGYLILQRAHLPLWLKKRWQQKPAMLQAIGLGHIILEEIFYLNTRSKNRRVMLRDEQYDNTTLSPELPVLAIYVVPKNHHVRYQTPATLDYFDDYSLQALVDDYELEMFFEGRRFPGVISLTCLETLEIFLSCPSQITRQEGLTHLTLELRLLSLNQPRSGLVSLEITDLNLSQPLFLLAHEIMSVRNCILGKSIGSILTMDGREFAHRQEDLSLLEKCYALQHTASFLNAYGLLVLAEKYIDSVAFNVIDSEDSGPQKKLWGLLFNRNGLTAMRSGYLCQANIASLVENMDNVSALTIIENLLTDASLEALQSGLLQLDLASIRMPHADLVRLLPSNIISAINEADSEDDEAMATIDRLVTSSILIQQLLFFLSEPAKILVRSHGISLEDCTDFTHWQTLLSTLNRLNSEPQNTPRMP